MTDDGIELTRRTVLAGTAAVGAAGVGAGVGTSALLSDEESIVDNQFTAGTLDMSVTATVAGANEYWEERIEEGEDDDLAIDGLSLTADGGVTAGLTVDDVKPGDWAIVCFDVEVGDNPAYVEVHPTGLESSENGFEEPEPEDDSPENGELEDRMRAPIYGTLKGVQPSNSNNPPYSYVRNDSLHPDLERESTVRELHEVFDGGVLLRDEDGDPLEVGTGDDAARRCLVLHLPVEVGNVIQGDSFTMDLEFHAEQVRNNDDPGGTDGGEDVSQTADLSVMDVSDGTGTHRVEVTVGSGDDGESLTELRVDYDGSGPTVDLPVDTLTLNGTDIYSAIDGAAADNGGERLTVDLDGTHSLSGGDTVALEYVVDDPGSGSAAVSVNGDGVTNVSW